MKSFKDLRNWAWCLIFVFGLVACQDLRPELRAKLEGNQAIWASQNIKSYSFVHSRFLAPSSLNYKITVSNGVFQSAIDNISKQAVPFETVAFISTIEAVFQEIGNQIESNQIALVTYDMRGVPTQVRGKPPSCPPGVQDCLASEVSITNFQVLP